jgi:hypothetical protein
LLKISKIVAKEPIYNLAKIDCVFIERFMRYGCFYGDGFSGLCIPSAEALLDF